MRLQFLLFSSLFILLASCGKYSKKNIESDLGYVNETEDEINYLPYLTTSQRLIDAVTVDNKYELEVYKDDQVTPTETIETGYFLALKKNNGSIAKWYRLSKKSIYGKVDLNSTEYYRVDVNIPFLDIRSTKPSPQTVYFDAEKDSTYTVFLDTDDSDGGLVFCSIRDSLGNIYHSDVLSHPGSGAGGGLSFAYSYSFTAAITGRIYLECYGSVPNPDLHHTLENYTYIWVQN